MSGLNFRITPQRLLTGAWRGNEVAPGMTTEANKICPRSAISCWSQSLGDCKDTKDFVILWGVGAAKKD